jgi:hypothetical protein
MLRDCGPSFCPCSPECLEKLSKKSLRGVSSAKIAVISQRNELSLLCFVAFYAFVMRLARLFRQFQKVNSPKFAATGFSEVRVIALGAKIFGPAKPLPLRVAIPSPSNKLWSCHNARA